MNRHDYAFPFRIDAASRQAAQTSYTDHVEQMIRQVLLTDPGERIDLPDFGCGLRRLVFAPHSDALDATTQLLVTQALGRWLVGQINVKQVVVTRLEDSPDPAQLLIRIDYVLIETRTTMSTTVTVF
jgi:phage baseplate assembly protein W